MEEQEVQEEEDCSVYLVAMVLSMVTTEGAQGLGQGQGQEWG